MKVMLFSDDVSEKDYQIARAIGMVSSRAEVISGEKLRDIVEKNPDGAASIISKYTMFEGMTVADKELAINKLRESGNTVAFLGNKLRELPLLRSADIGMTECITLTGGQDEKAETDGCEALRFVSDAVVTMVDMDSSGGLNSAVEVITSAKNINNNIDRMLRYLISSQSARLVLVIWSLLSGRLLLSPVAILALGLVLDLAVALIMAFKKPSVRVLAEKDRDISEKSIIQTLKQCTEKGAICGVLVIVFAYVLSLTKLIPTSSLASCAFLSLVTLSASLMIQTLSEGRAAKSELRVSKMQFVYLLAISALVCLCMVFKGFTCAISGAGSVSNYILIPVLVLPIVAPFIAGLLTKLRRSEKTVRKIENIKKKIKNKISKKAS